jgi:hypothetical protein
VDAANTVEPPRTLTRGEVVVLAVACCAAVASVAVYWLPLLSTFGFESVVSDNPGWRAPFLVNTALPLAILVAALASIRRWPRPAQMAILSAATMATVASARLAAGAIWTVDAVPLASLEVGTAVAIVAALAGVVCLAAIIGTLYDDDDSQPVATGGAAAVAGGGLLAAIGGQMWFSSDARLWAMPGWLAAGQWWHLVVTALLCLAGVRWRTVNALAAALTAAVVGFASALQQRTNNATPDELDGPTTITLLGYAVVVIALAVGAAKSARGNESRDELIAA